MADRQRWLWAIVRLAKRNRWTIFGSFAALTIAGDAVVAWLVFYNDPTQSHRSVGDFFVPFIIMSVLAILFWTAMAFGNLLLEQRRKALRTEEMTEVLAGTRDLVGSLRPPSLTTVLVVAILVGALVWLGSGFPSALATGGTWLIGGIFVRWTWLQSFLSTSRATLVSALAGLGVLTLNLVKVSLGGGGTIGGAAIEGAVMATLAFLFFLIMKRLKSPPANSASRLALEIRDRALAMAGKNVPTDEAAPRLLAATSGRRPAVEIAWDILRKRPKEDAVSSRAWTLVDQAIREGDWGWWPWRRDSENV